LSSSATVCMQQTHTRDWPGLDWRTSEACAANCPPSCYRCAMFHATRPPPALLQCCYIGAVKCSPNKPTTCEYMQTNKQTRKQVQLRKSRWLTSPLVALCEANRIHPPRGVCVPMQCAFVEVPVGEEDVGRTGGLDLCCVGSTSQSVQSSACGPPRSE
jgi:hypothetical protein